jgi:hypothetical protein
MKHNLFLEYVVRAIAAHAKGEPPPATEPPLEDFAEFFEAIAEPEITKRRSAKRKRRSAKRKTGARK